MINTISWILVGVPTGYVMMDCINHLYHRVYNTNISNFSKISIVISITFLALLRGYTGNDLVSNITNYKI
jgi:hypothetical protein